MSEVDKYSETNFRNTESIVNEFRSALHKYKDYIIAEQGGNHSAAERYLKESASTGFAAMEHAYKNFLYNHYEKQYNDGKIDESKYIEKNKFLIDKDSVSRRYVNHYDLKKEFESIVPVSKVDLAFIFQQAGVLYNDVKHIYNLPNPKNLAKALFEIEKFFKEYISKEAIFPDLNNISYDKDSIFLKVRSECDNFSDLYQFVFVSDDSLMFTDKNIEHLFSVNWDLFIDFDPNTQNVGLYEKYARIKRHAVASVKTLDPKQSYIFDKSATEAHWIIANGFADKDKSVSPTGKAWRKRHGRHLKDVLEGFKSTYVKPIRMFISESMKEDILEEFVEFCMDFFFDGKEDCVEGIQLFILNGKDRLISFDESCIERLDLSDEEFCDYLFEHRDSYSDSDDEIRLPQGAVIDQDLKNQLSNFCEILYTGIERDASVGNQEKFYYGERSINWSELHNGYDVQREVYENTVKGKINKILIDQPRNYYEITYRPGYGGTTLLRRIAWDFHSFYPTMLIYRYNKYDSGVLQQLIKKVNKTLFILLDSNSVNEDEKDSILEDLKSSDANYLVIYLKRIHSNKNIKNKSTLLVIPELSQSEMDKIDDAFLPYAKDNVCISRLQDYKSNSFRSVEERSPFYLAVAAYDKNFVGIRQYITNFMKVISDRYRDFLVYLAIADYINMSIDLQYFANILRTDDPKAAMQSTTAFSSLVKFNGETSCRLKLPIVTNEILRQAANGYDSDSKDDISFIKLTPYIIKFINTSRPSEMVINKNIVGFLTELLITRHEDLESEKPQFSEIIMRISGKNSAYDRWSHEGQEAVSSIFHALVDIYPEESHFKGHLARFHNYVLEDYDGALNMLDDAIASSREKGKEIPSLIHMKAMVYATRITMKHIPSIKKAAYNKQGDDFINNMIKDLQSDFWQAESLFEEVRNFPQKPKNGIAGHISDISLCISIINMGRTIDNLDTAMFLENHRNDWYADIVDKANVLFDECLEFKEELDETLNNAELEKIREIEQDISPIRNGLAKTIALMENDLNNNNVPDYRRSKHRRNLAKAHEEMNTTKDWRRITELMEANIQEEPNNESNIRIWFKSILNQKSNNPAETLRKAIMLLNQWIDNNEYNLEAHYHRYVLTFIEAVQGISGAENRLQEYLYKMRELANAKHITRRKQTYVRYWLGNTNTGIERLRPYNTFPLREPERASKLLLKLKGRVSKYANNTNAYIDAYQTDVFFSPSQTEGRINEQHLNQIVVFGVGFSFDGPRAYNSSVQLFTGQELSIAKKMPLRNGVCVQCEVLSYPNDCYIEVNIVGYMVKGSIHINQLIEPYSIKNKPKINGPLIEAWIVGDEPKQPKGNPSEKYWPLSMKPPYKQEFNSDLGEKLKKLLK